MALLCAKFFPADLRVLQGDALGSGRPDNFDDEEEEEEEELS